jgi:hypothetical protein
MGLFSFVFGYNCFIFLSAVSFLGTFIPGHFFEGSILAVGAVDTRSWAPSESTIGRPTVILDEITLRSGNGDKEYCLLPEQRNPVPNNTRHIPVFSTSVGFHDSQAPLRRRVCLVGPSMRGVADVRLVDLIRI